MARRRNADTLTIQAVLEAVDDFRKTIDPAIADPEGDDDQRAAALDYQIEYTYISPTKQRLGITRANMEGKIEGWPWVGDYEVEILASDGRPLCDPWKATYFDPESLKEAGKSTGNTGADAAAFLFDEYKTRLRNQRAEINDAEARAAKAKEELNVKLDVIARLQKEKADAIMTRDRAVAEKELAEEKQKVAEEALQELQTEIDDFKPHIREMIDRGAEHVKEILMPGLAQLGMSSDAQQPQGNASAEPIAEGDDPIVPGADDPNDCLNGFFESVLWDLEVIRELHDAGKIDWDLIRALVWLKSHKDVGPVPDWSAWAPEGSA